ncbi:nuclear transport factor 2 family protein [Deinococcus alpinitundrae]|uniref:nuclear transport factor 2 family protein n=1 Tax=Deinococcus alpinitundrae TaxID=468913 RepID=UPI00137B5620|nr:nuclear transport factor 2 family protein [Deinococcus alpinitundrae]
MTEVTDLADRYITIWNETDATRRRELIAQTWTEDASYLDPLMQGEGWSGIDAMIEAVQTQLPQHRFRRTSEVDEHHGQLRFSWEIGPQPGKPVAVGVDFATVQGDRLRTVTGFLDGVPSAPELAG